MNRLLCLYIYSSVGIWEKTHTCHRQRKGKERKCHISEEGKYLIQLPYKKSTGKIYILGWPWETTKNKSCHLHSFPPLSNKGFVCCYGIIPLHEAPSTRKSKGEGCSATLVVLPPLRSQPQFNSSYFSLSPLIQLDLVHLWINLFLSVSYKESKSIVGN